MGALAARLLHVIFASPYPVHSDASGYDAAARRLLTTGSFAFPVGGTLWSDDVFREEGWPEYERMPANAWSMPGYTAFLAAIYRLSGTGPGRHLAVRVTQAFLSVLTLLLVFLIADRLFGRRAAWAALALNALYPPHFWAAGYLLTETLFTLLLMAQVALMVRAAGSRGWTVYASLGVATAAAAYVRPVAAVVPALLLGLELHRGFRDRVPSRVIATRARHFVATGLVVAAFVAPWWIRNARIYRDFVPTTSAVALPMIQGEYILRGLAVPDLSNAQTARPALTGNDDRAYAALVAARLRELLPPASVPDLAGAQLERARLLAAALCTPFTFSNARFRADEWPGALQLTLLLLALSGAWRHRRRPEAMWLALGVIVCVILVHWQMAMLFARYLYPAMPMALALAGAGIVAWMPGGRESGPGVPMRQARG
jgi:4-amino-4-deoxy-L-arabinose transferase-like glycosyltransferase